MLIRHLPSFPLIKPSLKRLATIAAISAGLYTPAFSQICTPTGCKGPNLVINGGFEEAINDPTNPLYGFTTDFGYVTCPVALPSDLWGNITIMTDPNDCYNLWTTTDHTYGDGSGYMMMVDFPDVVPAGSPSHIDIWSSKVPVNSGSTYCFGAWYKNLNTDTTASKPNFRYLVNNTLIGVSAELEANGEWVFYGFSYSAPIGLDSVDITIQNGKLGGEGNDLAMDDIEFRETGVGSDIPVALNDFEIVPANSNNYPIPILLNDTLKATGLVSSVPMVSLVTKPAEAIGIVSVAPNGNLTFTPAPGVSNAVTQFRYELCQSATGCCTEALVTVHISPPLAVEVKNLHAVTLNNNSLITWITNKEFENSHFEVERSLDGISFEVIGKINGQGTTDQQTNYEYTDQQVSQLGVKEVYYRLIQVDMDGTVNVAGMVELNMSEQSTQFQVFAYPNPVKDDILKVELSAGEEVNVAVTLKDISGKVVRRDDISGLIGTRKHEMNVNHLPSGVYLLTVSHPRSTSHKKIVISR